MRAAIFSACARLFTKTIVVRAPRMWRSTSGATDGQIVPPGTCPRSSTGDSIAISVRLTRPQSTIVTGRNAPSREPPKKPRDLVERPLRRRQSDSLRTLARTVARAARA